MPPTVPTVTPVPARFKHEFPNGKVLFTQYVKLDGYEWTALQVLNSEGVVIAEQPVRIKMTSDRLEMQLTNVGGAVDDLVVDDNGFWTSEL